MVKRCFEHLVEGGFLAMVLPCMWLKPDKEGIHDLFMRHRLISVRCYNCVESNKLFGYKCQTPVSLVLVQKVSLEQKVSLTSGFLLYDQGYRGLALVTKQLVAFNAVVTADGNESMSHKEVMNPFLVGLKPHARQDHGQKATFDQMFETTLHDFWPNRQLVTFRRRGRRVWTRGLDAKGRIP